jgi:uncharacterized protein YuzE
MKITYDPEVDALYIQFLETTVTTEHLAEGIAADYDQEGRLAGLRLSTRSSASAIPISCGGSSWKISV